MGKYIKLDQGKLKEQAGLSSSVGAADAGKIIETDGTGRIDQSLLPVGIGADTKILPASEALSAGDFVNVFNDSGTVKVRKADASSPTKEANGFVLTAVTMGANATVYFEGTNNQLSGLTVGAEQFLATAGDCDDAPAATAGHIVQSVGKALSATELSFEPSNPIELA